MGSKRLAQILASGIAKPFERARARRIHFLHIGKTAGTQIGYIITAINKSSSSIKISHRGHDIFLRHIPADDAYFFGIRDPISRFKSGFYSRKRKGLPRHSHEWTACEAKAFQDFEHANDLAEALFSEGKSGENAFGAIKSISHTAMNQTDWFYGFGNLFEVRPPLAIIRQECFEKDMDRFQRKLGIAEPIKPTGDAIRAHKNDYSTIPELSPKAIENLRAWYRQDFEFYKQCELWIERPDAAGTG